MQENTKIVLFEFENWNVYKRSIQVAGKIQRISNDLPKVGLENIRDQIRRASQSIPLNLAEGCSRFGVREKVSFLRISKGSLFECVAALDILYELSHIDRPTYTALKLDMAEIGKMISGLIKYVSNRDEVKDSKD